jgi:23S rRNA (cytosine1962-C5)-methyltransferase
MSGVNMTDNIKQLINLAINKRESFFNGQNDTDAFRIINSEGDGIPGITVDMLGSRLLIEVHKKEAPYSDVLDVLKTVFIQNPIFIKKRWSPQKEERTGYQAWGDFAESGFTVVENGLRFNINILNDEHIGLFLDSRAARRFVKENCAHKRVLNLFSYTCGFGAAAALGGALDTVNIDNKNSATRIGKDNYILNELSFNTRTFYKQDAIEYLKKAQKQNGRFDFIILDPPPRFKRKKGGLFLTHLHYFRLLDLSFKLISKDGGIIVAGLNSLKSNHHDFINILNESEKTSDRKGELITQIIPDNDFPFSADRPVAKFFVLKIHPHKNNS